MVVALLIGIIILVILIALAAWVWSLYNNLVTLNLRVDNAWAQIDVQLKRRFDLIPNLVETVKGYAKHERKVFTDVAKFRGGLVKGGPEKRAEADALLTSALGRLMAVAEAYPKLKADANFMKLQEELTGTEDKISFVRTAYNDYVYQFNLQIKLFPNSVLAGPLGFKDRQFFKPPEEHRKRVKVKFE